MFTKPFRRYQPLRKAPRRKPRRRSHSQSLGRAAAFERLEDRMLLAAITETGAGFGRSVESAYALLGDDFFEINGGFTARDIDFFKIEAAAGGNIEVKAQAKPLEIDLLVRATARATVSPGGRT